MPLPPLRVRQKPTVWALGLGPCGHWDWDRVGTGIRSEFGRRGPASAPRFMAETHGQGPCDGHAPGVLVCVALNANDLRSVGVCSSGAASNTAPLLVIQLLNVLFLVLLGGKVGPRRCCSSSARARVCVYHCGGRGGGQA